MLWGQHDTAVRIPQLMLHLGRGSGNSVHPSVSWGASSLKLGTATPIPWPWARTINVLWSVWDLKKPLFSFFTCTALCFIVHISVLPLSALISQITQIIQFNNTKDKCQNLSEIKCLSSHSECVLCRREQHYSFQEKWNFKHFFL